MNENPSNCRYIYFAWYIYDVYNLFAQCLGWTSHSTYQSHEQNTKCLLFWTFSLGISYSLFEWFKTWCRLKMRRHKFNFRNPLNIVLYTLEHILAINVLRNGFKGIEKVMIRLCSKIFGCPVLRGGGWDYNGALMVKLLKYQLFYSYDDTFWIIAHHAAIIVTILAKVWHIMACSVRWHHMRFKTCIFHRPLDCFKRLCRLTTK